MRTPVLVQIAAATLLTFAVTGRALAQQPLTSYFPEGANAAASIQVEDFYESAVAQKEGWSRAAPLPGLQLVPAWANELVLGAHILPSTADSHWMVTLLPLPGGLTVEQIMERATAPVEDLVGRKAFHTRHGDYVIGLTPTLLGVMRPGARQTAARWIRSLDNEDRNVPSYLAESLDAPGQIVLALDLTDAIGAPRAREWLESRRIEVVPAGATQGLAETLARVRGCRLSIAAGDALTAEFRIDFQGSISVDAEHLKSVFLAVLADLGASIYDFVEARPSIQGDAFVLRGNLSADGLARIITLLGAPAAQPDEPPAESNPPRVAGPQEIAENYFVAIDDILHHLQRATRRASDQSRMPVWFDNFAHQIDSMETSGVPAELIEFGGRVASRLRAIAASSRGVRVEVDASRRSVTYDVYVEPPMVGIGLWGWATYAPGRRTVNTNLGQQRARALDAIAAGQQERDQIWSMIVDDRAEVLRTMRRKFGSNFARTADEER